MSMQYVSEKVVGRYIRRLRDITFVSTISIIILASYLCTNRIIRFLGQVFKMSCRNYYDGTYRLLDIAYVCR
jgi:hypothetical protein